MNALRAAVIFSISLNVSAQIPHRYTETGMHIIKRECRSDVSVVRTIAAETVNNQRVYVRSRALCVPKVGTFALLIDCNLETDTCITRISDHTATEIELGIRLLTDKRLKRI